MSEEKYNTPNSNCCGRPMNYSTEPQCNYTDACMQEYCCPELASIKEAEPGCKNKAVIPSVTVDSVEGITNLANCFVHVNDINTTFYVDDKHRIMITWAGPVDIPGYDIDTNPEGFKNQIVTDKENDIAVIYDSHGVGYTFGIEKGLDVTEAVNNKLDEMAEDGTLEGIIADYLDTGAVWAFDTVADMKAADYLANGSCARTLGFHSVNDGGGALYKITDTGTANEMDVIAVGSLFANLISNNIKNLKQYGCYGNGTNDDTTIINTVLQNLIDEDVVFIPKGTYLCTADINVTANNIRIFGEGQLISTIDFNNNGSIVFNGHGVKLDNIRFTKQDKVEFDSYHNTLNNVNVDHGNLGLLLKNAFVTECHNCYFTYNTIGVVVDDQGYEVIVSESVIDNNKLGILVTGTTGCRFENCTIEGNRDTSTNRGCGLAYACASMDIVVKGCWFEANGTSNDSVDILASADLHDAVFNNLITDIHSYYSYTDRGSAGKIILDSNHHLFTQYGVVFGGYNSNMVLQNCLFKGVIDKYNKPVFIMGRSNVIRYNTLHLINNSVVNTDNGNITPQMLSGIKGSYAYTDVAIQTQDHNALLTTDYYELDGEPLFVYMPFIKNLSSVTYLKQYQSGGTAYTAGYLQNNVTTSYASSGTTYLTTDGTSATRDIFPATGSTTYAFLMNYGKTVTVRKDSNVVQTNKALAEGYMEIRTDNLYNREALAYTTDTVAFALCVFNADEIKASKQCIAMKPKDYYPTFYPSSF